MMSSVEFHEFWLRQSQDIIKRWQRRRQQKR